MTPQEHYTILQLIKKYNETTEDICIYYPESNDFLRELEGLVSRKVTE